MDWVVESEPSVGQAAGARTCPALDMGFRLYAVKFQRKSHHELLDGYQAGYMRTSELLWNHFPLCLVQSSYESLHRWSLSFSLAPDPPGSVTTFHTTRLPLLTWDCSASASEQSLSASSQVLFSQWPFFPTTTNNYSELENSREWGDKTGIWAYCPENTQWRPKEQKFKDCGRKERERDQCRTMFS